MSLTCRNPHDHSAPSSKNLRVPKRTGLLTRFMLFNREFESPGPFLRATGATGMVAFGTQGIACETQNADRAGEIAVTL